MIKCNDTGTWMKSIFNWKVEAQLKPLLWKKKNKPTHHSCYTGRFRFVAQLQLMSWTPRSSPNSVQMITETYPQHDNSLLGTAACTVEHHSWRAASHGQGTWRRETLQKTTSLLNHLPVALTSPPLTVDIWRAMMALPVLTNFQNWLQNETQRKTNYLINVNFHLAMLWDGMCWMDGWFGWSYAT